MEHYTGLDVSVKETAICIVDDTGKISREVKVPSHPGAPSSASMDYLGLVEAVDRFGESIVVAVADTAHGRLDAGLSQALGCIEC